MVKSSRLTSKTIPTYAVSHIRFPSLSHHESNLFFSERFFQNRCQILSNILNVSVKRFSLACVFAKLVRIAPFFSHGFRTLYESVKITPKLSFSRMHTFRNVSFFFQTFVKPCPNHSSGFTRDFQTRNKTVKINPKRLAFLCFFLPSAFSFASRKNLIFTFLSHKSLLTNPFSATASKQAHHETIFSFQRRWKITPTKGTKAKPTTTQTKIN